MGKILVTGGTGFAGRYLCRRLIEEGKQIVAFVRPGSRLEDLLDLGIECRRADITDEESVNDNFSDIEQVYHLAASYRREHRDRDKFDKVNVEGTRILLEAAKKAKVKRFVHCSTVGVQGEIKNPPADEKYPVNPGDHYQESKMKGEILAREYFSSGLPGVVVRPVGLYGPGDMRFLKLFRSIHKGYFIMIGSGKSLYHLTYIDDLVQGMALAGTKPEALGQVFTIAGGAYTTVRELVNLIADVLGKPHPKLHIPYYPVYMAAVVCEKICPVIRIKAPLYPRRVEFFSKSRAFSIEKAKKILGYSPQISLREGLYRTADWYRRKEMI